jgi:hypothetical protein
VDAKVKASRVTLLWMRIRRRVSAVAGGDDLREAGCKSRFDSAYVRRTVAFNAYRSPRFDTTSRFRVWKLLSNSAGNTLRTHTFARHCRGTRSSNGELPSG